MLDISFSYADLQHFLLIVVRVTSFIFIAPFFGMNNTPRRVKIGMGLMISILLYGIVERPELVFDSEIEYAIIVMREVICGLLIGLGAQLVTTVTVLAGYIVDIETGMSMAQVFDVNTRQQVSISSGIYQYSFMLIMIISGMYQYLVGALVDSFTLIPVGGAQFNAGKLVSQVVTFMGEYMSIGFRIALPIFCCILLLNSILGILAKVAPQMNMFAVGMQLKVLTGLSLLYITVFTLPRISEFIFTEMKRMIVGFVEGMM
ncbi:flagellar biosynthetic protein FliR [Lachnospiraceae bacterium XBB2008]|nr:flagellar biosynthetic protein FliR [Lachnospiraceae bacterium]SCY65263.1 flagellar biosynthetic protein FliR [Lachnospiraceae bacterium XBB2008]